MDICHTLPYSTGICSKIEISDWYLLYFSPPIIDEAMCTVQVFKCRSATGKRHRVPGETWQVLYLYIVSGVGRNSLTDLFQLGKCVTCKQSSSTVGIQVTLEIQKYKICITNTKIQNLYYKYNDFTKTKIFRATGSPQEPHMATPSQLTKNMITNASFR